MRQEVVNFATTAASSANKTVASKRIDSPFRIKSLRAYFDVAADHTVKLYPFISFDKEEPTAAAPAGQNILAELSQADYLVGDGSVAEMEFDHAVAERGTYLKIYLVNSAATTPNVMVQIVIEIEE